MPGTGLFDVLHPGSWVKAAAVACLTTVLGRVRLAVRVFSTLGLPVHVSSPQRSLGLCLQLRETAVAAAPVPLVPLGPG